MSADGPAGADGLVDVHAHFTTERYIAAAKRAGVREPDGMPERYWPRWTEASHLDLMDRAGIGRSILSVSSPGVYFGDDRRAVALAREMNEVGAEVAARRPDRFGLFASLPLPVLDASLAEIRYAFDELGADGVIVLSNVAGRYWGSPELAPVLAELDRRRATVLIHPTSCAGHEELALGRPRPMVEFLFDTARTVIDLVLSGAAAAYPDLRLIVPHAGGVLPMLADRVELFRSIAGEPDGRTPTADLLARMYVDLAGTPSVRTLRALTDVVPLDRLLYGSDHAWTRPGPVVDALRVLDDVFPALDVPDWRRLTSDNARALVKG